MTIKEIRKNTQIPPYETELLLSFILHKSREYIISHPEKIIQNKTYQKYKRLEKKRLLDWPIAYLTGEKYFFGLNFKVNKNVLVPRPETELMVEEVIKGIKKDDTVIDIGTGSGAIIVSLAKYFKANKKMSFLAIDISPLALKIARENAKEHHVDIMFLQGNLIEPVIKHIKDKNRLIITANLPYLTIKETKTFPSIQKEPKIALESGTDGLKHYRELFKQLKTSKLSNWICYCEINPHQKENMKKLIQNNMKDVKIEFKKDLGQRTRLCIVEKFD